MVIYFLNWECYFFIYLIYIKVDFVFFYFKNWLDRDKGDREKGGDYRDISRDWGLSIYYLILY